MAVDLPYGKGTRMLTLSQLCEWLNITQRHVRKLVERDAIPYRKVGHLLRFRSGAVVPPGSQVSAPEGGARGRVEC